MNTLQNFSHNIHFSHLPDILAGPLAKPLCLNSIKNIER